MKQIKTIKKTHHEDFDVAVNEALADGWDLVRRDSHLIAINGADASFVYCGELVKEIIPDHEKNCQNCDCYESPCCGYCSSCKNHSNWGWNEEEKVESGEAPRWEADRADTVCSVCGFRCDDTYYLGAGLFCPECGAKMAEPLRPEWR